MGRKAIMIQATGALLIIYFSHCINCQILTTLFEYLTFATRWCWVHFVFLVKAFDRLLPNFNALQVIFHVHAMKWFLCHLLVARYGICLLYDELITWHHFINDTARWSCVIYQAKNNVVVEVSQQYRSIVNRIISGYWPSVDDILCGITLETYQVQFWCLCCWSS